MLPLIPAVVAAAQIATTAPARGELRGEALMQSLRAGGYTLLVRHARTDRSIPNRESPNYTPPLRADQRNLTADGERDVSVMAEVVRKYAIPIGEVLSSPVYRCRETADAFGPATITQTLRTWPTTRETAALVSAAPPAGTNRVLVTHHFVIEDWVPGIRPGDIGESEAAVVRPNGDGTVTLVGRILLEDWTALAGAGPDTGLAPSRAGPLLSRYIATFNTGDTAQMRAFLQSWFAAAPDRPLEARVQNYQRMYTEFGPLSPRADIREAAGTATVRAGSLRGELTVQLRMAAGSPDRIQSITFGVQQGGGHP